MKQTIFKWIKIAVIAALLALLGMYGLRYFAKPDTPEPFASGNGRVEATEVDLATKLPGRVVDISADEGDDVTSGEILARLDTSELDARMNQAKAQLQQAMQSKNYALALVRQHESELDFSKKNLIRSKNLYINNNISLVQLQQNETTVESMKAALSAAKTQVDSANAAINAAKAQMQTIQANLDDSVLRSPINGRVLYKLIEQGEVIGAGGKVLTILDLNDVYMSVFVPTSYAGRVKIGADARILLDATPNTFIPAKVSFVSPDAQFTPKEIETQSEREKLMFRVKVKVDPQLLASGKLRLNSGVPGIAYIRLDESAPWPSAVNPDKPKTSNPLSKVL